MILWLPYRHARAKGNIGATGDYRHNNIQKTNTINAKTSCLFKKSIEVNVTIDSIYKTVLHYMRFGALFFFPPISLITRCNFKSHESEQRYIVGQHKHSLRSVDTAGPPQPNAGNCTSLLRKRYTVSGLIPHPAHSGRQIGIASLTLTHKWASNGTKALRWRPPLPMPRGHRGGRRGPLKKNGKVKLQLWRPELQSLDERALEEFYLLGLFLCDLDWLARSSSIVVSLKEKDNGEIHQKTLLTNRASPYIKRLSRNCDWNQTTAINIMKQTVIRLFK